VTTTAHVFVVIVTLLTVGFILWLVRRHRLKSKYSILWLGIALALLALAAFPNTLDRVSNAVGIYYPPATILFAAVAFLFLVVVHFSWELSRLEERSRVLAEEVALLRASIERLEDRLGPQEPTGTASADASGASGAPGDASGVTSESSAG
jgi:hypothetical protein